jgi:hypothetical protein
MNLHEYQGKQLFAEYGLPVSRGFAASTPEEARQAAAQIGGDVWVVKAQVHAGGRGKAGGVKLVKTLDEVEQFARDKLGTRSGDLSDGQLVASPLIRFWLRPARISQKSCIWVRWWIVLLVASFSWPPLKVAWKLKRLRMRLPRKYSQGHH